MKAEVASVTVESRLVLSGRELSILNHICSYAFEYKAFAEARRSITYNGGVTEKEITEFVGSMRDITDKMMKRIEIQSAEMFSKNGGKETP